MMATTSRRKPPLLARGTVALTMISFAIIIAPRLLLFRQDYPMDSGRAFVAQGCALLAIVVVYLAVYWASSITPRGSSQKIVSTYLGMGAGIVVSAAQFIAYVVLAVQGAALVSSSLQSIFGIGTWGLAIIPVVLLLCALPVIFNWKISWWVYLGSAFLGVIALAAVLIGGLVLELMSGTGGFFVRLDGPVGRELVGNDGLNLILFLMTLFPAAILVLVAERPMKTSAYSRISPIRLGKILVPGFVLMSLTLYFIVITGMTDREHLLPVAYLADFEAGSVGLIGASIVLVFTGWAVSSVALWCLPRLVKELATDNVLPRYFATDNSVRLRLVVVLGAVAIGSALSEYLGHGLAGPVVLIFMAAIVFILFCLALAVRGHGILKKSMDRAERKKARAARWGFNGFALVGVGVVVSVGVAQIEWMLVSLALLTVPTILLLFFRKGRVRVGARLAPNDLTEGRTLPTRVHGVVLVNQLDLPALRALTFARAARLTSLTAVTMDFDAGATKALRRDWKEAAIPVNLTVLGTPQGASTVNIVEYVRSLRALRPADIVMVYVPRVMSSAVGQRFFIRHSTPRIISALRSEAGVVICEVPFELSPQPEEG